MTPTEERGVAVGLSWVTGAKRQDDEGHDGLGTTKTPITAWAAPKRSISSTALAALGFPAFAILLATEVNSEEAIV